MQRTPTVRNIQHNGHNVNPPVDYQLPLFPDSLIHHIKPFPKSISGNSSRLYEKTRYYGVSKADRVLSPQTLLKRFNLVNRALRSVVGLTNGETWCALEMLRYWAYYGSVYAKESTITGRYATKPTPTTWQEWESHANAFVPHGASKATFFRSVRKLRDLGLIVVIQRYLHPFRRQTSNIYRLDKLILLLAKYLAEHGNPFKQPWLSKYLLMTWTDLWTEYAGLALERVKIPL